MKKVSISGKGGVGKSVVITLLANVLSEAGYAVLTVDADESNPGLYRMLGFDRAPRPLMDMFGGEKRVIGEIQQKLASGGPGVRAGSSVAETISLDTIPKEYVLEKNSLKLLTVGKITTAFEGCACPMAEVIKLFLERLALKEREIAIVDMEAGVEHFGRGVEKSIDTVLVVVEPSFESVALAAKVNFLAQGTGVANVRAILNKVPSDEVDKMLREEIEKRGIEVIGTIYYDPKISEACLRGKPLDESAAKNSMKQIAAALLGQS